jgi:hypothetical protein
LKVAKKVAKYTKEQLVSAKNALSEKLIEDKRVAIVKEAEVNKKDGLSKAAKARPKTTTKNT